MDNLSSEQRSLQMSKVRCRDTGPELEVRRLMHSMGYRYRLHVKNLPGKPDIVFPGRGRIVFVNGCFWHLHGACKNMRWPKSRLEVWKPKLESNRKRDKTNQVLLLKLGWKVLVIWECELKNKPTLTEKILRFMEQET